VYSDSTIINEPLVQQTDERLDADDEDDHPWTDTVGEDEYAGSASQQITDSGSVGRYRWFLKQFSRSRCWYIPDVSYW
jgi:hypothetical protein